MVMVIVPIVLPIFLSRVLSWSPKDTIINKSVFLMIFTNGEIINIIIYFMLSPILEELFFREFLINHILNNNTFVIKVLITSTLFGLSHIRQKLIIEAFIGGVVLSIIFIKSQNIYLTIYIHSMYNMFCKVNKRKLKINSENSCFFRKYRKYNL